MPRTARPALHLLALLVSLGWLLGGSCGSTPTPVPYVIVNWPFNGLMTTDPTVYVSGFASRGVSPIADVTVNGVSMLPLDGSPSQGNWSTYVTLDPVAIINPIVVEMTLANGQIIRERRTVIAGDYVWDGDLSPASILMRFNDSGIDQIEPIVKDLVDLDLATLLPVGTEVVNECFWDTIFGCGGRARVVIDTPAPTITDFAINVDSKTAAVAANVSVTNMVVHLYINGSGVVPSCPVTISAASTNILGDYDLAPDPVVGSQVDVNQVTSPTVQFSSFNSQYGGVCDFFLIGDIIQAIIGDIQPMVRAGFEGFLADPDGSGPQDGPIADAIEVALADVEIAGPLSDAIGQTLDTAFFAIDEDNDGITFGSDGGFTANPVFEGTCYDIATGTEVTPTIACAVANPCADVNHECRAPVGECLAHPESPDFALSYHVGEPFPALGALTPPFGNPPTAQPYGLGLGLSTSAFNQLLKAQLECGLLTEDIRELPDLGLLTRNLLGLFIPEFYNFAVPGTRFELRVRPKIAPIVTGTTGPGGEISDLRIGGLQVTVQDVNNAFPVAMVFEIDTVAGLGVSFTPAGISFTLSSVNEQNIGVTITKNNLGASEEDLVAVIQSLFAYALPSLATALEGFPLPAFLGLQLENVNVDRAGEFMTLYLNMTPAP